MKTGIIVYAVGEAPEGYSDAAAIGVLAGTRQVGVVELITTCTGQPDLHYAWWRLVCLGAGRVILKIARFDKLGHLELMDRELRLCG